MPAPRKPPRPSVDEALGTVVQRLRKQQGLSQEQLGHLINSGRTYISELERGQKGATLKTIFRLAEGLHTKPTELIQLVEAELEVI